MGELQEYLSKTKKHRDQAKVLAQNLLDNSFSPYSNGKSQNRLDSEFPSLSPKRFLDYEEGLNVKLKEIYHPHMQSTLQRKTKSLKFRKREEVYNFIYLENKAVNKLIPKYMPPFERKSEKFPSPQSILGRKYLPNMKSPNISTSSEKSRVHQVKKELKKLYLIPILNKKFA